MVTEDFSQGGKYLISEYGAPPKEILPLFVKDSVYEGSLEHACITVNKQRKLHDLYLHIKLLKWDEHRARFGEEAIKNELERYTLRIDYDL
jgi:hypothetical protein